MADTCGQVVLGTGLTVLSHPLMYIKVLVQVGHEPLPPTTGRNIFGRQVNQLPGLFAYAKYIMKVDGKAGLFKGLVPRLCAGTVGTVVHSRVLQVSTLNSSNGALFSTSLFFLQMNHMGEIRNCSQAVTGFFASMLTYPFVLVSNLMAVNNCGLAGGLPPYASVYPTWLGCWRHLSLEGNMSRGNSLFFRKLPAGKMYAVDQKRFF
nr:mitochondrial carrier homolog 2 [Paramormyrops kingsleyae]